MHPALSVIFFTTFSGAGYGLLALIGILSATGSLPDSPQFAWVSLGLGFAFVLVGLLSSTLHLKHPERAWRALSQWRSSWLSREGVLAAVTTFVLMGFAADGYLNSTPNMVYGIIDRLIVHEDKIELIDYKTHRVSDESTLESLSQNYKKQLSLYREGIRRIWPDRPVKSGLLFTNSARLIWVD